MQESEIRAQLEKILASRTLGGSDQLKRLLQLVVSRTLAGQSDLLKEYNLGLEVFHRPADYDPKLDPIVRVQARRLRAKLDEYYAAEGPRDPVVIAIPKGAYVPAFEIRTAPQTARREWRPLAIAGLSVVVAALLVAWIAKDNFAAPADLDRSVAVLPLQTFTKNGPDRVADHIAEVLTTELAKSRQLRVVSRTTASRYRETKSSLPAIARELGVRWIIEGGVGVEEDRAYVKLRAVDSRTDRKVWADVFDCEQAALVSANVRAADQIAAAIEAELRR